MLNFEEVMIGLGIIAMVILVWMASDSKKKTVERFGGIIKSNKNIPRTTCYNLCDNNYNQCMYLYGSVDPGRCMGARASCVSLCNYSTWNPT